MWGVWVPRASRLWTAADGRARAGGQRRDVRMRPGSLGDAARTDRKYPGRAVYRGADSLGRVCRCLLRHRPASRRGGAPPVGRSPVSAQRRTRRLRSRASISYRISRHQKSEIRSAKLETNHKSESRMSKTPLIYEFFDIRTWNLFRISDFVLRI